jgi:hypothetical protein
MSNFLIDENTDLLAAEFVLGTLDSEERANAQSLLRTDHAFIAMVRIWERRFGELHLMVEPVEPDATILQRIKSKIVDISPSEQARSPSEQAPGVKPSVEVTSSAAPQEATGASADQELPKPVDVAAGGEAPRAPDLSADDAGLKPQDVQVSAISATDETARRPPAADLVMPISAEVPAVTEGPPAIDAQPSQDSRPQESAAKSEREAVAKIEIPTVPPLPPPHLKLRGGFPDHRAGQHPEITTDVIRSRGRWRAFGVFMTLLVAGLVALLAAWRLVPDRLPAKLRPAEVMMSIGIETVPKAAPVVKQAPPESQFDE